MRIILLGPPGAGKGTQAQLLSTRFSIVHISTGDMLRRSSQRDDAFGRQVKAIMASGGLVSDDIMDQLIQQRVSEPDCANGFILDGYPRTVQQAKATEAAGISIDYVIEIVVDDSFLVHRLTGRRTHQSSGRVYHIDFNPPQVPDIDDVTGEPLIQRPDDTEETVVARLQVYHDQTSPLVAYFKAIDSDQAIRYIAVDGTKSVEQVNAAIVDSIAHD